MLFHLEISTDNDAFVASRERETARLLAKAAEKVFLGELSGALLDVNGNQVGTFWFEEVE